MSPPGHPFGASIFRSPVAQRPTANRRRAGRVEWSRSVFSAVLISNGRFRLLPVFLVCGVVAVDIAAVAQAVALMAATGAVSGLGESAAMGVVARVRDRVRAVFGGDARSVDALDRAVREPDDADRIRELAVALAWYGQRDEQFAGELAE